MSGFCFISKIISRPRLPAPVCILLNRISYTAYYSQSSPEQTCSSSPILNRKTTHTSCSPSLIKRHSLSRPYPFKFFDGCLPQNFLSLLLNTLFQILTFELIILRGIHQLAILKFQCLT